MRSDVRVAATALLAPVLCIPLGVAKDKEVLAPFAHPSIFLFMGSFFLAEAMRIHGQESALGGGSETAVGADCGRWGKREC
jgi:sodium-dependent dicarboxylate transporter 2/3/5